VAVIGTIEIELHTRRWLLTLACRMAVCGLLAAANLVLDHVWHYRVSGGALGTTDWRPLEGVRIARC